MYPEIRRGRLAAVADPDENEVVSRLSQRLPIPKSNDADPIRIQ